MDKETISYQPLPSPPYSQRSTKPSSPASSNYGDANGYHFRGGEAGEMGEMTMESTHSTTKKGVIGSDPTASTSIITDPIASVQWHGQLRLSLARAGRRRRTSLCSTCGWLLPATLVFYSMLKEVKVGEPYLFKYQTEFLNLTSEQITGEIYPYAPYAYLIMLVPIFLLTDLLLYKPTMLTEVLGQIGFRSALVFGRSVPSQVAGMCSYGIASASEVAFFSYIYARLEKAQYRRLTSWTRAGTMAGRTGGYLFAQFFILAGVGGVRELNIIAFVMPCVVLCVCLMLPRVHWKVMIERMAESRAEKQKEHQQQQRRASLQQAPHSHSNQQKVAHKRHHHRRYPTSYSAYMLYRVRGLRSDFLRIYSVGSIRKWSLWWAMTTCLALQVALFAQTLWGEVTSSRDGSNKLNALTEATYTATATCAILAMNALPINWDKWGEVALVLISTVDAGLLALYARTNSIWVMYGCYIGYRSLYQVMITIAQWNIAKRMVSESYGLVFGTNSFVALILQSLLTVTVTDKRGLGLHIRTQYTIYALLHLAIAFIFVASVLWAWMAAKKSKVENAKAKSGTIEKARQRKKSLVEEMEVESSEGNTSSSNYRHPNGVERDEEEEEDSDVEREDSDAISTSSYAIAHPTVKTISELVDSQSCCSQSYDFPFFDFSTSIIGSSGSGGNNNIEAANVSHVSQLQSIFGNSCSGGGNGEQQFGGVFPTECGVELGHGVSGAGAGSNGHPREHSTTSSNSNATHNDEEEEETTRVKEKADRLSDAVDMVV